MTVRTPARLLAPLALVALFAVQVVSRLLVHAQAQAAVPPSSSRTKSAPACAAAIRWSIADLNKDGKPDIIALASGLPELLWYENPGWQKHVLASGVSQLINASAYDIDGDGIPEIAVAQGFTTSTKTSKGQVGLLTHGADVTAAVDLQGDRRGADRASPALDRRRRQRQEDAGDGAAHRHGLGRARLQDAGLDLFLSARPSGSAKSSPTRSPA